MPKEMNEVSERLREYCRYKRIPVSRFEKEAGLCNAYVASVRRSIGAEKAEKIRAAWPDLNISWVVFGEGEMILKPEAPATPAVKHIQATNYTERSTTEDNAWLIKMYEDLRAKDAATILDLQKQLYAAQFQLNQLRDEIEMLKHKAL